jgi:hypothetical protein
MAKTKISEYSATAANNTDVESVNIAEGCAPSGINNAIREVMSHLKDFQTGSAGDSLTVGGTLTSGTVDINGGAIDGTTIGNTTPAAGTFTQANFADNAKAIFGAGSDLEIYHDGSNSYISDAGTGKLLLRSDGTGIDLQTSQGETMLRALKDSYVRLYYDNVAKLDTTSTGIDVTGTVVADGVTVDGLVKSDTASNGFRVLKGSGAYYGELSVDYISNDVFTYVDSIAGASYNGIVKIRTANNGGSVADRVRISSSGVSFYEDTGTTPKLTWDASAESLNFADNGKAIFGAGSDLQIYHDGSNSYISDQGAGNLILAGNNVQIMNSTASANYITGTNGAGVTLHYNGPSKLTTTATGIDVTGTVVADGFQVGNTESYFFANASGVLDQNGIRLRSDNRLDTKVNSQTRHSIDGNGDISFYEDTGTTAKFFWDASAESLGIGTSSPPSYGSTFTVVQASNSGSGVVQAHNSTNSVITEIESEGTRGAVGTRTNHDLAFKTNQTERMRLTSTGLVGVGTTTPKTTLNIIGNAAIGTTNSNMMEVTSAGIPYFAIAADASNYRSTRLNVISSGGFADLAFEAVGTALRTGLPSAGTPNTSTPMLYMDASTLNVGIGTNSPTQKLTLSNGTFHINGTSTFVSNVEIGRVGGDNNMGFATGGSERARITSAGDLLVGATDLGTIGSTVGAAMYADGRLMSVNNGNGSYFARTGTDGGVIYFRKGTTTVGNIAVTGSTTTYNTSSDYRLKEDWVAVADAATRVNALKPINFAWKVDGSRVDGFLAHELAEVVPEAVTGEKDAVDAEGNPEYQGIDQSKLVPLLTAALQEALAKIESLTARVSALEGN